MGVKPKGESIGLEISDVSPFPIQGEPCNVGMVDQGTCKKWKSRILE